MCKTVLSEDSADVQELKAGILWTEHFFDATSCDSIEKTLNGNSTRGQPDSRILTF